MSRLCPHPAPRLSPSLTGRHTCLTVLWRLPVLCADSELQLKRQGIFCPSPSTSLAHLPLRIGWKQPKFSGRAQLTCSWMLVLSLRSVSWKFWFLGSRVAQRCTSLNAWSNLPRRSSAWHRRYNALMSVELMSMATEGD